MNLPETKRPIGSLDWSMLDPSSDDIWQAKLDGAFVYLTFDKDKGIRAFSYRRSKRDGEPIEHTEKIYGLKKYKIPQELHGAILEGEAWHPDLESREVGGILNTRNRPLPESLFVALHGVHSIPGEKRLNNQEKVNLLTLVKNKLPVFDIPDTAITEEGKVSLKRKIETGTHEQTKEGIIIIPADGKIKKSVLEPTHDASIVGTTPGEGKYKDKGIGAILVGSPENPTRVGTGLSDSLRRAIYNNPKILNGLIARVKAKDVFPSGRLRSPVLKDFHPEKSTPESLNKLKKIIEKQASEKEFAPGIPIHRSIESVPEFLESEWEYTLQRHDAERAGTHYDLRLADPETGHAHSWAIPKTRLPDSSSRVRLAIQQPTHTISYMDFEGDIPSGYGKGKVGLEERGKVRVRTSPDKIEFSTPSHGEMALIRTDGNKWIIVKKKNLNKTAGDIVRLGMLDKLAEFSRTLDPRLKSRVSPFKNQTTSKSKVPFKVKAPDITPPSKGKSDTGSFN